MKLNCRILFALILMLMVAEVTSARIITVMSLADSGPRTLREALADAANGDTIDVARVHGSIQLASGELFVGKSVAVVGPGPAQLAIDGNLSSRVFHVGPGVVVDISGLTITNGFAPPDTQYPYYLGAGIYNDHGTLTVSKCIVIGNIAGDGAGIVNDGSSSSAKLMVVNSLVNGNWDPIESTSGGGILNLGENGRATLIVIHSTVSDNYTGYLGGGIYNDGYDGLATATVINSAINDNGAGSYGGGIYNAGWDGTASLTLEYSSVTGNAAGSGGGVYNAGYGGTASLTVSNTTIADNQADDFGGGLCNGISGGNALMKLVNSTISQNSGNFGGGVFSGQDYVVPIVGPGNASLEILNCTLSDNSAETIYLNGAGTGTMEIGSTIINASASGSTISSDGSFNSLGYNLSSDDASGALTATTDLINTDPRLGPLQDNGGPTLTQALHSGSPAINQGKNFSDARYDQRGPGFVRVFKFPSISNAHGDGTDIGAFEVQPFRPKQADWHFDWNLHTQPYRE
jgi:hypothetical protein